MKQAKIIIVIVLCQFFCTSVWFATNAVISDLAIDFLFDASNLSLLTSVVQFGFILGTLSFAFSGIVDRYSPSKVFFYSAILGGVFNASIMLSFNNLYTICFFRFFVGFFLAGIYPVGMKIAADHYEKGLGKVLGFLIGALVLGTALPHLLKVTLSELDWRYIVSVTSLLCVLGGLLMYTLIKDGPFRKIAQEIEIKDTLNIFKNKKFKSAAFGYFGHMWELYTFWAFVPIILKAYQVLDPGVSFDISIVSFCVIGIGAISCVLSGYFSIKIGVEKVAYVTLFLSAICCLASPFVLNDDSLIVLIGFLLFWGAVVIADSPMFSTLVAISAEPSMKGTSLTIVNCIGYMITIVSIQTLGYLSTLMSNKYIYVFLALGPLISLFNYWRKPI